MKAFWLGMALEITATLFGTVGKQLVCYSKRASDKRRQRLIRVLGMAITTFLGPLSDSAAYALAAQSFVAPLSGLDIVWNALSAPFTLGEKLAGRDVAGTLLVFFGAAFTAVLGPHKEERVHLDVLKGRFLSVTFLVYAAVFACGLISSAYVLRRHPPGSGSRARAIALGGTAGCIAGNMSFLSSALSAVRSSVQTDDWSAFESPFPYVLIVCAGVVALGNIPFLQVGLQEYQALFMVPLFEGCHIFTACISGQVVNKDLRHAEWWRYVAYWASVLMIVAGLSCTIQSVCWQPSGAPAGPSGAAEGTQSPLLDATERQDGHATGCGCDRKGSASSTTYTSWRSSCEGGAGPPAEGGA